MNDAKTPARPPTPGVALDEQIARALTWHAEASSRRGLLAKLGKVALVLAGVAVVPQLLPVDRRVADAWDCGDWRLCGIWGRTCDCCNGGCLNCCPDGSQFYSYWQSCCPNPFAGQNWMLYWDCCNGSVDCSSCTWCYGNGSSKGIWCGGGTYNCTAVVTGDSC